MEFNEQSNPWLALPDHPPYILASDAQLIERFNASADDSARIHLEIMPEPFLGRRGARVVLLNLNPGYSEEERHFHSLDEYFRQAILDNLRDKPQAYPFYFLDPAVRSPGHLWWQQRLRTLVERSSAENVSRNLLCVEYFPYHSKRYDGGVPMVPSQQHSFALVRAAIRRRAVIIVMRAQSLWTKAIPELSSARFHNLNSSQAVYITKNNCPTGFEAAVAAIEDDGTA